MTIAKRSATTCLIAVALLAMSAVQTNADLLVQPNDMIAVCTDCRSQPHMASVDIEDYFLMCCPVAGVRVYDASEALDGISYFKDHAPHDLKLLQPNVVLLSHGITERISPGYERGLTFDHPAAIKGGIENLKSMGVRTIVLGSSGVVDTDFFGSGPTDANSRNGDLAQFRDSDLQSATTEGVPFADIYTPMLAAMAKAKAAYGNTYHFGSDVNWDEYPAANGQLVMAYAFLKALGCDGAIGTITVDLNANTAVGTPGQKIVFSEGGVVEVQSTRYPFCFSGDPTQPESTSGVAPLFPFNDDLNRYLLIVKGLKTPNAKITWGAETREVSSSNLAGGVNLAALFAGHTPFDSQFAKVDAAVWAQQQPENAYNELYFPSVDDLKVMAPTRAVEIDKLGSAILAQDKSLAATAAALVTPVYHTISIVGAP